MPAITTAMVETAEGVPIHVSQVGKPIAPSIFYVFSIYPEELKVKISRRAPTSDFVLPAGSAEFPSRLEVRDTWEGSGTADRPHNVIIPAEHTALHIVNDLTRVWGANPQLDAHPGVWMESSPTPSKENIAKAYVSQQTFWADLVASARKLAREKEFKLIQPRHYLAAKMLGVSEDWTVDLANKSTKPCRFCFKEIDGRAGICPECGQFQSREAAEEAAALNAIAKGEAVPPPMPDPKAKKVG